MKEKSSNICLTLFRFYDIIFIDKKKGRDNMKIMYYTPKEGTITINFKQPYVIEAEDLKKLVKAYIGKEIRNICTLFWEEGYCNDSYKALNYKEILHEIRQLKQKRDLTEREQNKFSVCDCLDYFIPGDYRYDYILIDVTW